MNSLYSQLNQDLWVIEVLKGKKNGIFVDVGAFDGVNLSNTYMLEKDFGWNGICVEANSDTFNRLKEARDCVCVKEMLSDSCDNTLKLQHMGELSYGNKNVFNIDVDEMKKKHEHLDTTIEYHKTKTLNKVLEENNVPKIIDYLSIDVEGMEYDILKVFDFNKYHINTLTVEHNAVHIGMDYRNKLFDLLTKNGFIFVKGNDNVQNWVDNKYYIEDFYVNKNLK